MPKYESRLGNTTYTLEEQGAVLQITRQNSDGKDCFFFPRDLLVEYLANKACIFANRLICTTIAGLLK